MTQDKKPARNLKKVCNFRYLPPDTTFPPEKVTSVCAVPFMENGQIVVIKLDRGWDIAGGHAQEGEVDFIETAKREAMEEGYMTIKDVSLALVIESDYFGSSPEELTYMLCYSAGVDRLLPFEVNNESFGRKIASIEEFLRDYEGNGELIEQMILSCLSKRHHS